MIPELDLAADDNASLARRFAEIYGAYGFGYLTGHGIDPDLTAALFDASRRFHALPLADKMRVALDPAHRGYIPLGTSTDVTTDLAEVTRPNQSESFMMMREDATPLSGVYLSGPNQWPDLPGFRDILERYHAAMVALGQRVMRIALMAAGTTDMTAIQAFAVPTTWLRLLHYPPVPGDAPADLWGSAPHRDFGCLTFLAQDAVGGLQVQAPERGWIDVPPKPGSIVLNVGDMLRRMSNGRLRSTPHRVINRSGHERYSCPFFFDPHVSATIAPLPGTGVARFEPLNFGDFLRAELSASYVAHKPPTGDAIAP